MKFASASAGPGVNAVQEVMPFVFNVEAPTVDKIVHTVKTSKDNEYIFFTPDTFFVDKYEFDMEAFKKEMQKAKEDMLRANEDIARVKEEIKHSLKDFELSEKLKHKIDVKLDSTFIKLKRVPKTGNEIHIYTDSNFFRVYFDKIEIPVIELPDIDSLEALINEATKQVQSYTFSIPEYDKNIKKFEHKLKVYSDSLKSFKFDLQVPNVDSLYKLEMQPFDTWVKPFLADSMNRWFHYFNDDKSFYADPNELKMQMLEFEKEMKKFREEMERMKKELRKDSVKVQQKKPVEI
jgi:hypothetical protein